jgi:hypothetical protein
MAAGIGARRFASQASRVTWYGEFSDATLEREFYDEEIAPALPGLVATHVKLITVLSVVYVGAEFWSIGGLRSGANLDSSFFLLFVNCVHPCLYFAARACERGTMSARLLERLFCAVWGLACSGVTIGARGAACGGGYAWVCSLVRHLGKPRHGLPTGSRAQRYRARAALGATAAGSSASPDRPDAPRAVDAPSGFGLLPYWAGIYPGQRRGLISELLADPLSVLLQQQVWPRGRARTRARARAPRARVRVEARGSASCATAGAARSAHWSE